jgi:uncharacterized protein involved in cysteine biosynthesis
MGLILVIAFAVSTLALVIATPYLIDFLEKRKKNKSDDEIKRGN